MAEVFEFLRVRETGTKGSSFWRRSTKRRRVRLFARERDGDKGFEFSEPKTRFKISDSSGAPKASFPYTRGKQKTLLLVNLRTAGFWRPEGFDFLRLREAGAKGSTFWRPSTKRRRVRLFARERDGDEGFDFLAS